MLKNGIIMLPVDYKTDMKYESWDEASSYGAKKKRDVFVELFATYRLTHSSGEWIDVVGYGHATDNQDKAAGKATTYALKYAQMYVFNLIIGTIDDTDLFHSDDVEVTKATPKAAPKPAEKAADKPKFVKGKKEAIDDVVADEPVADKEQVGVQEQPIVKEQPTPQTAQQAPKIDADAVLKPMYAFKTKGEVMAWFSKQVKEGDDAMKAFLRERKNDMLNYAKTL
jgi:hypothetical protein